MEIKLDHFDRSAKQGAGSIDVNDR